MKSFGRSPSNTLSLDWQDYAACRKMPVSDVEDVFFQGHKTSDGRGRYLKAIEICKACPVIRECRREFTQDPIPQYGVFFGKTPMERQKLRNPHVKSGYRK